MAPFQPRITRRTRALRPSATVALTDRARALTAAGRDVITMSAGEPDFPTPALVVDAAVASLRAGFTHYAPSAGLPELQKVIVDKLRDVNGIPGLTPGDVLVLPGAKAGLMFACLALLEEGDECVCPEPAWVSYRECVAFCGATYVPVPTRGDDGFSVSRKALEAAVTDATRMLVINSPTNPTGKVWRRDELEMVADVVRGRDIVVLSDEIYEDLLYDGARHVSFASLPGMAAQTLTLNGLSKSCAMTGWRLGYVAGPTPLVKAMLKIQQHSTTCATSFVQKAGITAVRDAGDDVRSMVEVFTTRRERLLRGLSDIPGVVPRAPEGTFYMFIDVSALGPTDAVAEELLESTGLALTPGGAFGDCGEGYLRISFAASEHDIDECCRRLREYAGRRQEAGK